MSTAMSSSMLQEANIRRDTSPGIRFEAEACATVNYPKHDTLPSPEVILKKASSQSAKAQDRRNRREWMVSVLASVGFHAAVVGAMMVNWSFSKPDEAAPPASMMVELSVMPASPPVPQTEIPPGPEQVKAAPKPLPNNLTKFDPPPQVDSSLKPDFALPLKDQVKPTDAQVVAKDARETTAPQATPAPVQERNKAPVEGNNAAPPSDAEQAWEGRILAKLERNKRYPAAAQASGQQDTVFVRLVIDRRGQLLEASLKKSAGFAMLDSETLALARRASPFPAPPSSIAGERIVRIVPVEFYIKKRR